MTQRWEYMHISLYKNDRDLNGALVLFKSELGAAGAQGWEAVGAINVGAADKKSAMVLLLKRPAP
jgi:hypothetical protein